MDNQSKILVVDNEPRFLELARISLETGSRNSYQVITASDRKKGLEKAKQESPALVIVGAMEPRGDAFKLHEELRNTPKTQDIPMLVVDVRPEEHSRKGWRHDEGMQMDAEGYIARPVKPTDLVRHVEMILGRVTPPTELRELLERVEEDLKRVEAVEKALMK